MATIHYTNFTIEPKIRNKGPYYTLSICQIFTASGADNWEVELVVFGKCFNDESDIEQFQKSKFYKDILKAAIKNTK